MKSQTRYIPFLGVALCAGAIELFLVPGILGKLGTALSLIVGVFIWLARHFGSGPVWRALGAILFGAFIGVFISSSIGMGFGMTFGHLISPDVRFYLAIAITFLPVAIGAFTVNQCSYPKFIQYSFIAGLAFLPTFLLIGGVFFHMK